MWNQFQHYLIREIQDRLPENISLFKELKGLLGGNDSNVYKKIKGEVALSGAEALLLARHYGISIDGYVSDESKMFVSEYEHNNNHPVQFMKSLCERLSMIRALSGAHLYYVTNSLPVFTFLHAPQLTTFKLYMWSRMNWQVPECQKMPYGHSQFLDLFPETEPLRQQALALYTQLPTFEFWSWQAPDNMLSQIKNLARLHDFFSLQEAIDLLDAFGSSMTQTELMAQKGQKTDDPAPADVPFHLFLNEVFATSDNLLITDHHDNILTLFSSVDSPNFIKTTDRYILENIRKWLDNLRRKSMRISRENETYRRMLFASYQKKIEQLKAELA